LRARILATAVMALIVWGAAGPASAGPPPARSRSSGEALQPGIPFPALSRPLISGVQQPVTYGQRFKITSPQAGQIARVAILTVGHEPIKLKIVSKARGSLVAVAPSSPDVALPGGYLLIIAEARGSGLIPSAPVAFVLQPTPPDGHRTVQGRPSSVARPSRSGGDASILSPPGSASAGGTLGTGNSGGRGSPGDDTRTGAQHATDPVGHRSPLGSPPWMSVALVLAFLATATGLKRLS
jgi:hypothetical protein